MGFTISSIDNSDPNFKDIYVFHGKSAYQSAVEAGYQGTEDEWVLSLRELRFGSLEKFDTIDPTLLYVDIENNKIFRYDDVAKEYKSMSSDAVLGDTEGTAFYGDKGKIAYEHAIGGEDTHPFLPLTGGELLGSVTTQTLIPSEITTYDIGKSDTPYANTYSRKYYAYDGINNMEYASLGILTEGTDSGTGIGDLTLGNEIADGIAGNAQGRMIIYGYRSGYTKIYTANNSTSNNTIYFPAKSGTIALTTDAMETATKLATARTISLTKGATGSGTFDGSADASIEVTAIDPSVITQSADYKLVTEAEVLEWSSKPSKTEVEGYIAELVGSSPDTLDTLAEIATALGEDPNFATTMTTELGKKLNSSGGNLSGDINTLNILPGANNTYDIGSDVYRYKGIYATNFYEGGTALSNKYLSLSGGTMTGKLTVDRILASEQFEGMIGNSSTPFGEIYTNIINIYQRRNNKPYLSGMLFSGDGDAWLRLGTGYATGTIESVRGFIEIYGEGTASTSIFTSNNGTTRNTVYLPSADGTLALTTDTVAAADKLATARTIELTGSIIGSGTFDGSGDLSIETTTNHTHDYLPLSGGTMTGDLTVESNIRPYASSISNIGTPEYPFNHIRGRYVNVYDGVNPILYGAMHATTEGTTEDYGVFTLYCGNNTATGTAGNAQGRIVMYGTNTGYTRIIPTNNTETNYLLYLPTANGTLAIRSEISQVSHAFNSSYTQGTDLNTYVTAGVYTMGASSWATTDLNFPLNGIGGFFEVYGNSNNIVTQVFHASTGTSNYVRLFERHYYRDLSTEDGTNFWSDWSEHISNNVSTNINTTMYTRNLFPVAGSSGNYIGSSARPYDAMYANNFSICDGTNTEHSYLVGWIYVKGTEEDLGCAVFNIGNSTASGTAGNARGCLTMFGTNTGAVQVWCDNSTETNYTLQLPNNNGRLVSSAGATFTGTVWSQSIYPRTNLTYDIGANLNLPRYIISNSIYIKDGTNSATYASCRPTTVGTEDTVGVASLYVGNSVASGTAANSYGRILIYGTNTGCSIIRAANATTTVYTVYIPAGSGDFLTTATSVKVSTSSTTPTDTNTVWIT